MLVNPPLRRFVVMSGGHCTFPTGGPAIRLKNKKTDEAEKAETVLSAVRYNYIYNLSISTALMIYIYALGSYDSNYDQTLA